MNRRQQEKTNWMKITRRCERSFQRGKRERAAGAALRPAAVAGAILCLLAVVCGGTYAYFSAKDQVVNQLDMAELDFEIEEPSWEDPSTPVRPGDVLPKDPQIVNTGEVDFVVRVKIQEVWDPKNPADGLEKLYDPDYVRYFAANTGGEGTDGAFTAQQLLNILRNDAQLEESQKNFALRRNLTPNLTNPNTDYWAANNPKGWYRGTGENSEWLYYNQVVHVNERTDPVFRAVTIRTEDDIRSSLDLPTGIVLELPDYNKYDLDIYVYAETVQADAFAWEGEWGADIPEACSNNWSSER